MVIAYRTHSDMFKEDWCGEIEFLHLTDPYKMVVHARGNRFDIIFGKGINGSYICIPNWQIGTEIASLKDLLPPFTRSSKPPICQFTAKASSSVSFMN